MNTRLLILVSLLCLFTMGGCKYCRFEYPNAACKITPHPASSPAMILVLPFADAREAKDSTEGWSMLCFLPLVPYVPFHNYDLQGKNADVGYFDFRPLTELNDAIIRHINISGIAHAMRFNPNYAIRDGYDQQKYILKPTLHKLGIDGKRTLYCCGLFPGCYLAMFGAPFNYSTMTLDMELSLENECAQQLFSKRYTYSIDYVAGEYYNWNCLKYLGMDMCKIMNDFCADVQGLLTHQVFTLNLISCFSRKERKSRKEGWCGGQGAHRHTTPIPRDDAAVGRADPCPPQRIGVVTRRRGVSHPC